MIGIGGSVLGPQFVSNALGSSKDPMKPFFFNNTDPDGFDRVLEEIGDHLSETLTIVISKSGGTRETHNGMLEAKTIYQSKGLPFEKHAAANEDHGIVKTPGELPFYSRYQYASSQKGTAMKSEKF